MRLKELFTKFIAGVMATSIFVSLVPTVPVSAKEADMAGTSAAYSASSSDSLPSFNLGNASSYSSSYSTTTPGDAAIEEDLDADRYSVTADTTVPAFSQNKGLEKWAVKSSYKGTDKTYCLTLATGASGGETVLYYCIKYKNKNGVSKQEYIFPNVDGADKTERLLLYYSKNQSIYNNGTKQLATSVGYKDNPAAEKPLDPFTVQSFVFEASDVIASVQKIDVYLERGQWTPQGMALYKVDEYRGYEEYGLVSGGKFFDFKGYMVAEMNKKNKGEQLTFNTSGSDKMYSVGGNYIKASITNYPANTQKRDFAINDSVYSLRLDFTDRFEGGIEAFVNSDAKTVSSYDGIVEDLAVELQYQDTHGWTRKVLLPVILNSYATLKNTNPNDKIMGFAQRGDTIAFQGLLPEFASVIGETVIYTGNNARKEISNKGVTLSSSGGKRGSSVSTTGATDDISLSGISLYKGGCMPYIQGGTDINNQQVAGATVQYTFENSDPIYYYTIAGDDGRKIYPNSTDKLSMKPYTKGNSVVAGPAGGDKYLITLYTNDSQTGATESDIGIKIHYSTMEDPDYDEKTPVYHVKEEASKYMGKWPTANDKDFVLESGLVAGGKISFVATIEDVRDFTGVEITVDGEDEWIMDNLVISYLESYKSRRAYNTPYEQAGVRSNFFLQRDAVAAELFNLRTSIPLVYDENGNEVGANGKKVKEKILDEDGKPVLDKEGNPTYRELENIEYSKFENQLFFGNDTYTISFNSEKTLDVRKIDYSKVMYSMTHEQTQVNWGFFKKRKTYEIAVEVAPDDAHDSGNGNAGSKNHFYFQLVFENGRSGYVLANQQITSDGFRSNMTEVFYISTNQDYGEVNKIRIIPEDVASDADPYDKLNIKSITVSESTNGGSYLSYVFNDIGWIEIDYHDEGETSSLRSRQARTQEEIAKEFERSYKESRVKILCEIPYLPWDGDFGYFTGNIKAKIYYTRASDGIVKDIECDVAKLMAQYQGISATTVEGATNPDDEVVSADGSGYRTNPKYMMRPYHTDRFILPAIADLGSINSIEFTVTNVTDKACRWDMGKISLSQVIEDGAIQKNANDELYRNMTVKKLCTQDGDKTVGTDLPVGMATPIEPITFTNKIEWKSQTWATPVSRLPENNDDKINVYIYPTLGSKNDTGAQVDLLRFKYFIPYSQYMTQSQNNLAGITDGLGRNVYYYKGLPTNNMVLPSELVARCVNSNVVFDKAIVQHMRGNTVVGTYPYYFGEQSGVRGASADYAVDESLIDITEERLAIQFGPGTPEQGLVQEARDVAVSFTYTSTIDDGKQEYQSPYVYLTDQGYQEISEGLFAELKFEVPYVKEITGYTIAGYGELKGNIDAAAAEVYSVKAEDRELDTSTGAKKTLKRTKRSYTAFAETYALSDRLTPHKATSHELNGEGAVAPVSVTFTTSDAMKNAESGTDSAVSMVFTYRTDADGIKTKKFVDITRYIQPELNKQAGETTINDELTTDEQEETINKRQFFTGYDQTVKVFLPELNKKLQILSVKVLPYNAIEDAADESTPEAEETKVEEVDVTELSDDQVKDTNSLSAQVLASLNASWSISKLYMEVGFDRDAHFERNIDQTFKGIENGGIIRLVDLNVTCSASMTDVGALTFEDSEVTVVGKSNDVITGVMAVMGSTAGFKVRAYEMVGSAPVEVTNDTVAYDTAKSGFSFTTPVNDSGELKIYKIEIIPTEGEDLKYTINLTVKSDEKKAPLDVTCSASMTDVGPITFTDKVATVNGKSNDVISGVMAVTGSTAGFSVRAYALVGSESTEVTNETVTSDTANGSFNFTTPVNDSGSPKLYRIEIIPTEAEDMKYTINLTVDSSTDEGE